MQSLVPCRRLVTSGQYGRAMTTISLQGLGKTFGDAAAVRDVSFDLPAGSFTALLGPSGCGKTTLLRLIAGFEQPSAGTVSFDGVILADAKGMVPPERRNLGIVFQSYALWPHMDVAANVAYPLRSRGMPRPEIDQAVLRALTMVSLGDYAARGVDGLSGGQRQRVALARCLVTGTNVILLDEPLANLDVHLRAAMLDVFADIHRKTGATIVFVTHDQSEALALADRIVVLDRGQVQQVGTPQQIYAQPVNAMVANFVGRGSLVRATVENGTVMLGGRVVAARGIAARSVTLLVRPEAVRLVDAGIEVSVRRTRYAGAHYETWLTLPSGDTITADLPCRLEIGAKAQVAVDDAWIVPA